jgi:hypothetical protein
VIRGLPPLVGLRRLRDPRWSARAVRVGVAILSRLNAERGWVAWPSTSRLAEDTGLPRSSVCAALAELCGDAAPGPLFARRRGSGRRANEYEVVMSPSAFSEARDRARRSSPPARTPTREAADSDAALLSVQTDTNTGPRAESGSARSSPPTRTRDVRPRGHQHF